MAQTSAVLALFASLISFGLLTGTYVWNNNQGSDIDTIRLDKTVLQGNVSSLEARVAMLQEMCTDVDLNETVNGLRDRLDQLNEEIDSAGAMLMISPPERVSKGQLLPLQSCSGSPCQIITTDGYLVMSELQAGDHAVWAPGAGFPPDAAVNVTETGNYWFGMFIANNERSGGGASTFSMELVDENDLAIDVISFTELHDINGASYYRSYYTAMELQAGTFIKYRVIPPGTLWIFSDFTFGFVIRV